MSGRWSAFVGATNDENARLANASRAALPEGSAQVNDDDANVVELRAKIRALVQRAYGGSFRALFDHHALTGAPGADKVALETLLHDADVGNILTRGMWVHHVMERVDTNRDGFISWDEFAQIVGVPEATGQAPPTSTPSPTSGFGRAALASIAVEAAKESRPSQMSPAAEFGRATVANVTTSSAQAGSRLERAKPALAIGLGLAGVAGMLVLVKHAGER